MTAADTPMRRRQPLARTLIIGAKLGAVLFALLVLWLCVGNLDGHQKLVLFVTDANTANVSADLLTRLRTPFLNALPILLLMLLLLAATRKLLLSFWLGGLVAVLLDAISDRKVAVLGTPLVRQDFQLLRQAPDNTGLLLNYVAWQPTLLVTIGIAVLVAALLIWREPPLLKRRTWWRWPSVAGVGVLLGTLLAGFSPWQRVYDAQTLDYQPWGSAVQATRRYGDMGLMVLRGLYDPSTEALVSDPAPGEALLQRYRPQLTAAMAQPGPLVRPDIVVVQSESLFDPAIMNGFQNRDWLPNFHRLAQRGQHGWMQVPTFGGGTIRTEFEVLTGLPLAFFPYLEYPYLGLTEPHVPGMAHALDRVGYATLAVHPHAPGFWNRASVFRRMGFARFISSHSPAFKRVPICGYYACDSALTDVVLAQLDSAGPPQFVFAISMQNHGPYVNPPVAKGRRAERDAIPLPAGIRGEDAAIWRNYLLHLHDADLELGRLADALRQRQRPAILVFYGDHLPGLGDGYAHGFRNGEVVTAQKVPYLIVPIHGAQAPRAVDLPSWMLAADVLATAGVHDDTWFALERLLAPALRAVDWQPDATLQRQLASLANLRLHDAIPAPPPEPVAAAD